MRILITGANGQLGNEFRVLSESRKNCQFTFVDVAEMDLADNQAIVDFFEGKDFDFLVNCAAYTAVDKAEEQPSLAYRINSVAAKTLAETCRNKSIRMIHISTDYVFDGSGNIPLKESDAPRPLSVYGKSKLEGEQNVLSVLDNAYVIRTSWVYSTFGKNFVKTILKLANERPSLKVVNDQVGSPTYARDLAFAIMVVIDKVYSGQVDIPGVYHFTNEGVISWYDFAWFIVHELKLGCTINAIPSESYPTPAARPRYSVLNKSKISDTFEITAPHWFTGLEHCLRNIRDDHQGQPGK